MAKKLAMLRFMMIRLLTALTIILIMPSPVDAEQYQVIKVTVTSQIF